MNCLWCGESKREPKQVRKAYLRIRSDMRFPMRRRTNNDAPYSNVPRRNRWPYLNQPKYRSRAGNVSKPRPWNRPRFHEPAYRRPSSLFTMTQARIASPCAKKPRSSRTREGAGRFPFNFAFRRKSASEPRSSTSATAIAASATASSSADLGFFRPRPNRIGDPVFSSML